jgi:L1 cell adhesion molecule like protein
VSAEEKTTGKKQIITITNDGSRLSQEDIEKMVEDAEKFKEEDAAVIALMEARNRFENYVYQTKQTIEDENLKSQLGDNYENIKEKINEASNILDIENVSKEEFNKVQEQLENYINPIIQDIMKNQQEGTQEGMGVPPNGPSTDCNFQPEVPDEPPIEEID